MSDDIDVPQITHRILVERILQLEGQVQRLINELRLAEDITGLRLLGGLRGCGVIPLYVGPDFAVAQTDMSDRFGNHATELIGATWDLTAAPVSSDVKDQLRAAYQEGW